MSSDDDSGFIIAIALALFFFVGAILGITIGKSVELSDWRGWLAENGYAIYDARTAEWKLLPPLEALSND